MQMAPSVADSFGPWYDFASNQPALLVGKKYFDSHSVYEWVYGVLHDLARDQPDDPWMYIGTSTALARKSGVGMPAKDECDASCFKLNRDKPDYPNENNLVQKVSGSLAMEESSKNVGILGEAAKSKPNRVQTEADLSWYRKVPSVEPFASQKEKAAEEAPRSDSQAEMLFKDWLDSLQQKVPAEGSNTMEAEGTATKGNIVQTEADLSRFRRVPSVQPFASQREAAELAVKAEDSSSAEPLFMDWLDTVQSNKAAAVESRIAEEEEIMEQKTEVAEQKVAVSKWDGVPYFERVKTDEGKPAKVQSEADLRWFRRVPGAEDAQPAAPAEGESQDLGGPIEPDAGAVETGNIEEKAAVCKWDGQSYYQRVKTDSAKPGIVSSEADLRWFRRVPGAAGALPKIQTQVLQGSSSVPALNSASFADPCTTSIDRVLIASSKDCLRTGSKAGTPKASESRRRSGSKISACPEGRLSRQSTKASAGPRTSFSRAASIAHFQHDGHSADPVWLENARVKELRESGDFAKKLCARSETLRAELGELSDVHVKIAFRFV
jgi:hypothetical protein